MRMALRDPMSPAGTTELPEKPPHLDDRQHSLVGLRVGVDFKALPGVAVDDGVGGPPCARGGVILVFHRQVDDDPHSSFLHGSLKLPRKQTVTVTL